MTFNFLKGKKDEAAPDIGKEEEPVEEVNPDEPVELDEEEDVKVESEEKQNSSNKTSYYNSPIGQGNTDLYKLEIQKLTARIEALNAMINGYGERFSMISQQIGEVRAMNLSNEKLIGKVGMDSAKAIDIVREVKPDRLRLDYQKIDIKNQELQEKIASYKEFIDTIMTEIGDIKRKMGSFLQTEQLLKLNEEIKKDLFETQQVAGKAKMQADKTEQFFVEIRNSIADSQKLSQKVNNLETNYSGFIKDVQKIKIDFSNIVSKNDFNDFKNTINNKFMLLDKAIERVESIKEDNERLGRIIETTLNITNENRSDISDIAMTIGNDRIKKVSDYDNQLNSILSILDSLAGEIAEIKKNAGMKSDGKLFVAPDKKKIVEKGRINMKYINLHPHFSKNLVSFPNYENIKEIENIQSRKIEINKVPDVLKKEKTKPAVKINKSKNKKIENKNKKKR